MESHYKVTIHNKIRLEVRRFLTDKSEDILEDLEEEEEVSEEGTVSVYLNKKPCF